MREEGNIFSYGSRNGALFNVLVFISCVIMRSFEMSAANFFNENANRRRCLPLNNIQSPPKTNMQYFAVEQRVRVITFSFFVLL